MLASCQHCGATPAIYKYDLCHSCYFNSHIHQVYRERAQDRSRTPPVPEHELSMDLGPCDAPEAILPGKSADVPEDGTVGGAYQYCCATGVVFGMQDANIEPVGTGLIALEGQPDKWPGGIFIDGWSN